MSTKVLNLIGEKQQELKQCIDMLSLLQNQGDFNGVLTSEGIKIITTATTEFTQSICDRIEFLTVLINNLKIYLDSNPKDNCLHISYNEK